MKISETHKYEMRDKRDRLQSRVYVRIPHDSSKPIEVFRLRTNKSYRKKGYASTLVNHVVSKYGWDRDIKLGVCPEKGSGLTKKDLYRFYGRFGFIKKKNSQTMVRIAE